MNWIMGISKAIDYVEQHITEPINYEEIAKYIYSSSFHFQRIFSAVCGFTLGDYIRFRRLSLAGNELATGNVKVLDIAMKYGYDTPESFSRAFARFHGVTPSKVKNGAGLKSFSPLSVKLIISGGFIMDYRIEQKESFDVILKKKHFAKQHEITTKEISRFWEECQTDGTIEKLIKYIPKENIFNKSIIGISFYAMDSNKFPYGIGVHYNGEKITDENFVVENIPAATYAVFKCVGKMPEAFAKVYKYICTEFFPKSEYQPCGVEIEAYPSDDTQNPDYTCEIWVSVEKKKTNN